MSSTAEDRFACDRVDQIARRFGYTQTQLCKRERLIAFARARARTEKENSSECGTVSNFFSIAKHQLIDRSIDFHFQSQALAPLTRAWSILDRERRSCSEEVSNRTKNSLLYSKIQERTLVKGTSACRRLMRRKMSRASGAVKSLKQSLARCNISRREDVLRAQAKRTRANKFIIMRINRTRTLWSNESRTETMK